MGRRDRKQKMKEIFLYLWLPTAAGCLIVALLTEQEELSQREGAGLTHQSRRATANPKPFYCILHSHLWNGQLQRRTTCSRGG